MPRLYLALVHHPVVNKNGEIIASAVTNLDLHDMARAAKTYGIDTFYVVTPLADQKELIEKIARHWTKGFGGQYNPDRCHALRLIQVRDSLRDVREEIAAKGEGVPRIVVTTAANGSGVTEYKRFRKMIHDGRPYVLTFGTAWGLSEELIGKADYVLEPIRGVAEYNHLSVRSAASIILDRLLGDRG